MSMKTKYNLVVIVAWLIVAGLIIIPRFLFTQPAATAAINATNADIVNAINDLQTAINSLKDTIYNAMLAGVGIILAAIVMK